MQLRLEAVSKRVGSATHLYPLDLALAPGGVNVLLGATLAGKTTLMRLMAGLDRPTEGKVLVDGRDVTGVSVRQRNLAMVYQQFINYPSLTVFDNIASPLKIAGKSGAEIRSRVGQIAETLRLTPFLQRLPAALSGGQQQRTALARALAKDADLLLLDEPLVNLDYKLREELRFELAQLFANRATTVVYATTEPQEALQMGGHAAILDAGRILQFGRTIDVFNHPATLAAARAFSDPPLNVVAARLDGEGAVRIGADLALSLPPAALARIGARTDATFQLGMRAHQFRLTPHGPADRGLTGKVELAEISGSDTFLHVKRDGLALVAQLSGVHDLPLGEPCTLYIDPADIYGFDAAGALLFAPTTTADAARSDAVNAAGAR